MIHTMKDCTWYNMPARSCSGKNKKTTVKNYLEISYVNNFFIIKKVFNTKPQKPHFNLLKGEKRH